VGHPAHEELPKKVMAIPASKYIYKVLKLLVIFQNWENSGSFMNLSAKIK